MPSSTQCLTGQTGIYWALVCRTVDESSVLHCFSSGYYLLFSFIEPASPPAHSRWIFVYHTVQCEVLITVRGAHLQPSKHSMADRSRGCTPVTLTKVTTTTFVEKIPQSGLVPSRQQSAETAGDAHARAVLAFAASTMATVRIHAEMLLWCIGVDSGARILTEKLIPEGTYEVRFTL